MWTFLFKKERHTQNESGHLKTTSSELKGCKLKTSSTKNYMKNGLFSRIIGISHSWHWLLFNLALPRYLRHMNKLALLSIKAKCHLYYKKTIIRETGFSTQNPTFIFLQATLQKNRVFPYPFLPPFLSLLQSIWYACTDEHLYVWQINWTAK